MNATQHMTARMQQRSLSKRAISITLEIGEWNSRGDQISASVDDLDTYIDHQRALLQEAERLRRRGGATVVVDGETMITAYDRSRTKK